MRIVKLSSGNVYILEVWKCVHVFYAAFPWDSAEWYTVVPGRLLEQ